jgi:hypothetical protein
MVQDRIESDKGAIKRDEVLAPARCTTFPSALVAPGPGLSVRVWPAEQTVKGGAFEEERVASARYGARSGQGGRKLREKSQSHSLFLF